MCFCAVRGIPALLGRGSIVNFLLPCVVMVAFSIFFCCLGMFFIWFSGLSYWFIFLAFGCALSVSGKTPQDCANGEDILQRSDADLTNALSPLKEFFLKKRLVDCVYCNDVLCVLCAAVAHGNDAGGAWKWECR